MTQYDYRSPIFSLTKHAELRCRQRGIRSEVVRIVLQNFDRDHHAGANVSAISISRRRLQILQDEGHPTALLEQAARTVLLVAEDGGIVTAINRPTWHNRRPTNTRRIRSRNSRSPRHHNRSH